MPDRLCPSTATARRPSCVGVDMEDVPLTLADLVGAVVIGLALGALIGFGI
jgi:hypothetical protein